MYIAVVNMGSILLTRMNFIPNMDKESHARKRVV